MNSSMKSINHTNKINLGVKNTCDKCLKNLKLTNIQYMIGCFVKSSSSFRYCLKRCHQLFATLRLIVYLQTEIVRRNYSDQHFQLRLYICSSIRVPLRPSMSLVLSHFVKVRTAGIHKTAYSQNTVLTDVNFCYHLCRRGK